MSNLILCPNTALSPNLRISDDGSCNKMIWENGKLINPDKYDFSRIEFICERLPSGGMTDYAVSDMGCSVVSERLKSFLDAQCIDNIQYFRASVIEREGEPAREGFYAANIVGLVDCIDRDASEMDAYYDKDGNLRSIFSIDKLVLKDNLPDCGFMYRVFGFSRLILIDESFKEKIQSSGLTGINLVSPEKWDGFYGEL